MSNFLKDPDPSFLPDPDPSAQNVPDPLIRIRNTGTKYPLGNERRGVPAAHM